MPTPHQQKHLLAPEVQQNITDAGSLGQPLPRSFSTLLNIRVMESCCDKGFVPEHCARHSHPQWSALTVPSMPGSWRIQALAVRAKTKST